MENPDLALGNPERFIQRLNIALQEPLPGVIAQTKMAPQARRMQPEAGVMPRQAAVLLPLYPDHNTIHLLFTHRPDQLAHHAGEISFPGGGAEPEDPSLIHTALREAREELGIPSTAIQILGALTPLYIPPSQNLVHPFAGWIPTLPPLQPDPQEVDQVLAIPLDHLLHPEAIQHEHWWLQGQLREIPCYRYREFCIWGATAMMLSEFFEVVQRLLTGTD